MWTERVSNPEPLTYESGALPIALRGPAIKRRLIVAMSLILDPKIQSHILHRFTKIEDLTFNRENFDTDSS